jgi:hypothetical protein
MSFNKQEFYEGAALRKLICAGVTTIAYEAPFFRIDDSTVIYLKYSTKGRSPWGFTFMPAELSLLEQTASDGNVVVGLVCGPDGVAAVSQSDLAEVVGEPTGSAHVSCYRNHGHHYEIFGPAGAVPRKIAPSSWARVHQVADDQ